MDVATRCDSSSFLTSTVTISGVILFLFDIRVAFLLHHSMMHPHQLSKVLLAFAVVTVVSGQSCTPCADGDEFFSFANPRDEEGIQCDDVGERADNLLDGTDECYSNQLTAFQGGCCDFPPSGYCTLCPDGSSNFNGAKVIPREADVSTDLTCQQIANKDFYLLQADPPGTCSSTERGRAATWCECGGVFEPECTLLCPDGSSPSELTLHDPIFQRTCEQFTYLFTTLTEEECPNAGTIFNFDAIAFCCPGQVLPPASCSICPDGMVRSHPDTPVFTERDGSSTCGDVALYAAFLPPVEDACRDFLFEIDLRDGEDCCEVPQSITIAPTPTPEDPSGSLGSTCSSRRWLMGLFGFSILQTLMFWL